MTNTEQNLSPNKQALLKIRQLKEQLAAAKANHSGSSNEGVAVVSMACRFPQSANTPEKFWESLVRQDDLVSDVPDDRWELDAFVDDDPEVPGKMYARRGVFLDDLDQMDPEFFGISPREATWVDPQQRLLMEVGWEAIERAGWIPDEIAERTGVFVGWMHNDYQNEASDSFLNLNPYIATGAAGSFLPGRIAHCLGLQGPSIAVDTACSSSLVALHLAIQSLQQHDCDRALVGGVNAICSPTTNILTCKLKALSPSGHSRAFDAAADGYLRGEGCGVVTLRRLSDAQRDGDTILGIIRGTAVGHNGGGSGLTVPNPKAQQQVIREAIAASGFAATDIDYLEAHGTGTELGDPIEVGAAAAAYCAERKPENPLLIGSVKTNIGHLEAAAGMAGLIKVLLAMQNGSIPGQMNFETPNPHIPWDEIPVKVLTEETAWPSAQRRVAGVSAFGMSGTNAHVVIEAPPSKATSVEPLGISSTISDKPAVLTVSGKSEEAVFELAAAYSSAIQANPTIGFKEFALSSSVERSHFDHRAAIVADSADEAAAALQILANGGSDHRLFTGNRRRTAKVAWMFTGQGSQYVAMGRRLYQTSEIFKEAIDSCDRQLADWRDGSLLAVLFDDATAIDNTHWTQPAIFALQMGLAELLQSWNLKPDVVLGHSVGQYAAACVAGVMSWPDGLRLIAERGRLIGQLPSGGQMLAVFASTDVVTAAIEKEPAISLAAMNISHNVVSGDAAAIDRLANSFADNNIRCKKLTTSHAFHSQLMQSVLEPFAQFANAVEFRRAEIPLVCNVTGTVLPADTQLDGQYWATHIREAVAFAASIETLAELNCDVLLEIGPQAVLTKMAAAGSSSLQSPAMISCLEKDGDDNRNLSRAAAQLYTSGVDLDFRRLHHGVTKTAKFSLPTYPFQRRRFWGPAKPRAAHCEYHTAHPMLGPKLSLAGSDNETRYENFIEPDSPAWLPDHEVMNAIVLPGAALVEMAIEVAGNWTIKNLVFEQPIRPSGRMALQTVVQKSDDNDNRELEVFAQHSESKNWSRHFSCQLTSDTAARPEPIDLSAMKEALSESDSASNFYAKMNSLGLNYGPAFRCIESLHFSETEILTKLQSQGDLRGYNIAPTLLDAALHSLAAGLLKSDDDNLFLPVAMGSVQCYAAIESEVWCYAKWKQNEGTNRTADIFLCSSAGIVLLKIEDLKVQQVSATSLRQMSGAGADRLVYDMRWQPGRLTSSKLQPKRWLLIHAATDESSEAEFVTSYKSKLQQQQHDVVEVALTVGSEPQLKLEHSYELDGTTPEAWLQLFELLGNDSTSPTAARQQAPFEGIIWFINGQQPTVENVYCNDARSVVAFVQSMIKQNWRRLPCGIQLVTRDAILAADAAAVAPAQTQFWGLGRVLSAEQPELRCRLLDLSSEQLADNNTVSLAVEVALNETPDNQHAIRDGALLVPRMQQTRLRAANFQASAAGCYLVTGGLGMLGRQVAAWLAEHGAKQLVLVSRRQPDAGTQEFIDRIGDQGCQVVVHAADMGSRSDVESLFAQFGDDLKPLTGIVHAAGILDDGLIESQTVERFESVLRPKIAAAMLLDELSRPFDLDLFVLYSSAASVLGSPGQSNYALGNAFLDGLAQSRRSAGLPGVAINWGPWNEGMADDERILKRLAFQGITPLAAEEAHAAMEKLLMANVSQATVMDVDWRRMRTGPSGQVPSMLQDLGGSRKQSRTGASALVAKLRSLKGKAQSDLLVKTIQDVFQNILSTPEAPETDRPLIEMGLDSLMAVEFGTELQQLLGDGFNVSPTMLFDYPTIDTISEHLLEIIMEGHVAGESNDSTATPKSNDLVDRSQSQDRDDIAIIGISCRFPGAQNVDEFWQNLLNGVDAVCDIPNDRWDIDRFYSEGREPGKMYTRRGGFLDDIAEFDPAFFNISEQEACWIDPQHRMLLENSYRAMEDAGIPTAPLIDPSVGVFMGIMGSDYAFLPSLDNEEIIQGFLGAGLSHSAGVGRISYLFGFEGPSVAIDTASSSSLVAVHQAMRSLQDGNCNLALAGGANAILAPVNSLLMSKAGLLSPDGRCKSFSESADGFGRGEGCGVVVLKRLADAQQDGDRIMAVIRGGAVVHNGFSGGITTPSGKAQSRVIDAAIKDAGIAPSEVQYLEAHGTGTEYGDPMELAAALKIYGKGRKKQEPLLIGSVKANISHLEAAGGSSGLIKTVLAIHHGIIPQQIHCEAASPHIPWKRMPAEIVSGNTDWPNCERRTAGVTALGLVGTNAHLVLSEAPVPANTASKPAAEAEGTIDAAVDLLVISARCENALGQLAGQYAATLESDHSIDLADFCFTLAAGRRHFEYRVGINFNSRDDLIAQLRGLNRSSTASQLNGRPHFDMVHDNNNLCDVEPNQMIANSDKAPKIAWVFDQEQQSVADTVLQLTERHDCVAEFVQQCAIRLAEHIESSERAIPLLEMISASTNQTSIAVSNYLLQASLCHLYQHWGLQPDATLGLGIGQYTATCAAGGLCFYDALILVYERSRLAETTADETATESLDRFEKLADQFNFYPPNLPLICGLSGEIVAVHRSLGGSYWRQHASETVDAAASYRSLATMDCLLHLLMSDYTATAAGLPDELKQKTTVAFSRTDDKTIVMTDSLRQLYRGGCELDFNAVYNRKHRNRLSLPTYPFQKSRYWITEIAQFMSPKKVSMEVESARS